MARKKLKEATEAAEILALVPIHGDSVTYWLCGAFLDPSRTAVQVDEPHAYNHSLIAYEGVVPAVAIEREAKIAPTGATLLVELGLAAGQYERIGEGVIRILGPTPVSAIRRMIFRDAGSLSSFRAAKSAFPDVLLEIVPRLEVVSSCFGQPLDDVQQGCLSLVEAVAPEGDEHSDHSTRAISPRPVASYNVKDLDRIGGLLAGCLYGLRSGLEQNGNLPPGVIKKVLGSLAEAIRVRNEPGGLLKSILYALDDRQHRLNGEALQVMAEVLSAQAGSRDFPRLAMLEQLQQEIAPKLAGDDAKIVDPFLVYVRDVIRNRVDLDDRRLQDDQHIGLRAVLAFMLEQDADKIGRFLINKPVVGLRVRVLQCALIGFRYGLSGLPRDIKAPDVSVFRSIVDFLASAVTSTQPLGVAERNDWRTDGTGTRHYFVGNCSVLESALRMDGRLLSVAAVLEQEGRSCVRDGATGVVRIIVGNQGDGKEVIASLSEGSALYPARRVVCLELALGKAVRKKTPKTPAKLSLAAVLSLQESTPLRVVFRDGGERPGTWLQAQIDQEPLGKETAEIVLGDLLQTAVLLQT